MTLKDSQSLHEGINHVNRDLLTLVEHDVHTLKEGDEVFVFNLSRERLLEHPLNHCIQSSNEVFLINIEGGTCTNIDDLEGTQQTS